MKSLKRYDNHRSHVNGIHRMKRMLQKTYIGRERKAGRRSVRSSQRYGLLGWGRYCYLGFDYLACVVRDERG